MITTPATNKQPWKAALYRENKQKELQAHPGEYITSTMRTPIKGGAGFPIASNDRPLEISTASRFWEYPNVRASRGIL